MANSIDPDASCCLQSQHFCQSSRDKGVFDDIFSYFSFKPYVVTPHLNCLVETVQMRGHNIWLYAELTKIVPNYHQILPLIKSSVCYWCFMIEICVKVCKQTIEKKNPFPKNLIYTHLKIERTLHRWLRYS